MGPITSERNGKRKYLQEEKDMNKLLVLRTMMVVVVLINHLTHAVNQQIIKMKLLKRQRD